MTSMDEEHDDPSSLVDPVHAYLTGQDVSQAEPKLAYYDCPICGNLFDSTTALDMHQVEHNVPSGLMNVQGQQTSEDDEDVTEEDSSQQGDFEDDTQGMRRSNRKRKRSVRVRSPFDDQLASPAPPIMVNPAKRGRGRPKKNNGNVPVVAAVPTASAMPSIFVALSENPLTKTEVVEQQRQTAAAVASDEGMSADNAVMMQPPAPPMQPLHLVGGSCIYCGFEIKKPWDLVTHMVEQHDVQISNLSCGDALVVDPDLSCAFCGVIFTVAHDLFYHMLIGHAKKIFGKEAMADFCAIEMITSDHKKLTLKVRINRKEAQSAVAGVSAPPAKRIAAGQQPHGVRAPKLPVSYQSPRFQGLGPLSPMMRYRSIQQPLTVQEAIRNVIPFKNQEEAGIVSDEVIAEAEAQVRLHQKGFQCSQCYKVRQSREDAVAHVYKCHMTLRKYACPHCPKNYDNLKNLQTHVNACHSVDRLYQCPNCPMRYKYPGDLKRHLGKNVCQRYKTGGYPCPKCGLMWYHQSALASHQRQCDAGTHSAAASAALLESETEGSSAGFLN